MNQRVYNNCNLAVITETSYQVDAAKLWHYDTVTSFYHYNVTSLYLAIGTPLYHNTVTTMTPLQRDIETPLHHDTVTTQRYAAIIPLQYILSIFL